MKTKILIVALLLLCVGSGIFIGSTLSFTHEEGRKVVEKPVRRFSPQKTVFPKKYFLENFGETMLTGIENRLEFCMLLAKEGANG